MNMPMGGMNPEIAQMLHLPNPMMAMNMGNMNQMNQMAQLNQMGQMAQMGQMGNMPFTPQQMQAMQQQMGMGGMGMDGMMMQQQQQQFQQQQQQMQGQQGLGQMQGQPMHQRSGESPIRLYGNDTDGSFAKDERDARARSDYRGGRRGGETRGRSRQCEVSKSQSKFELMSGRYHSGTCTSGSKRSNTPSRYACRSRHSDAWSRRR